ncbi:MAG: hypothetical protein KDK25_00510 [Leptospiraceae bacterium]|nr:hypothetical protein [Leptospiraceae bacterium]
MAEFERQAEKRNPDGFSGGTGEGDSRAGGGPHTSDSPSSHQASERGAAGEGAERRKDSAGSKKTSFRRILSLLPGRKWDYFLLSLVVIDTLLLLLRGSYDVFLDRRVSLALIGFDFFVLTLWGIDFLRRLWKEEDRWRFLTRNWYEVIGLIPIVMLRPFLLLRGVKLGIAFYKLGKASEDVSQSLTREITFRFRDIIVDTIADAVFLQSLGRVEEVMSRLDYAELARKAFKNHQEELDALVKESLHTKSMMGELSRIPFMDGVVNRIGGDVSKIISEVLEAEVAGSIMKEITRGILAEMHDRVRQLDLERLTSDGRLRKNWSPMDGGPGDMPQAEFAGEPEKP